MTQVDVEDVRARARAAFLGLAVGDALGATVEFMTAGEIRAAHGVHREVVGGGWLRLRPGQVTDDTTMSLALARAIVEGSGWDLSRAAEALAAWLRAGPPDAGNTVRRGLRRYLVEGTVHGAESPADGGNGAAMRMVPVALATLADAPLLERLALEQAWITHHHPLSDAACIHVGALLHRACLARSRWQLRRASVAFAAAHPAFRLDRYRGLASGYVVDTIETVLHFFHTTRGFEECLVAVVNQGGDADTTGALAGAIAGAFYGREGLPRRWVRALEPALVDEVEALADRLVSLSPLGRGTPPRLEDPAGTS